MRRLRQWLYPRLLGLAYAVQWNEPECMQPMADGRRCGFYREAGIHESADQCPALLDGSGCPEPSGHHRFRR